MIENIYDLCPFGQNTETHLEPLCIESFHYRRYLCNGIQFQQTSIYYFLIFKECEDYEFGGSEAVIVFSPRHSQCEQNLKYDIIIHDCWGNPFDRNISIIPYIELFIALWIIWRL